MTQNQNECTCEPRHFEIGGYDKGCPVHDPNAPFSFKGVPRKKRIKLEVEVDFHEIPGSDYSREDAVKDFRYILMFHIPHYHPTVKLVEEETSNSG